MQDCEIAEHAASSSEEAINESVSDENSLFENSSALLQSPITSLTKKATVTRTPGSSRDNIKRKKLTIPELEEQAAMKQCLSIINQAKSRDEWSIFGDNVASELRLLQAAPDLQLKLKNTIQHAILDISYTYASRRFPLPSLAATTNQSAHHHEHRSLEACNPPAVTSPRRKFTGTKLFIPDSSPRGCLFTVTQQLVH